MSVHSRLWLGAVVLVGATGCQTRVEVAVNRTPEMTERSIELRVHGARVGESCPAEAALQELTPDGDLGDVLSVQELRELPGGTWSRGPDLGRASERVLVVAFGRAEDCTLVSAGCAEFDPARPAPVSVTLYPRTGPSVQCTAPATCSDRFCRVPAAP